jgi:vacuolar-type H+-ATPase subunit H
MSTLQSFRLLALVSVSALLGTLGSDASAQSLDADDAVEATALLTTPPTTGPVSVNASFRNGAGHANLTFNPDGTYLFSGSYSGRKPMKDLDVVMAVRASTGATLLFRYVGDASSGAQWSKQGSSDSIRDFWSAFAAGDKASVSDRFYESATGKRAEYEARERKREELQKAEDEARKRHQEQVAAEKKAELQKQQQEQAAQEQAQASQQQSSGGSAASSVMKTVGTVASIAGTILSFL